MDLVIFAVVNKGFIPSHGVRKPTEVKLKCGANIWEEEPRMANKVQHLIEKHAVIWTDQGVIEMPLGEKMNTLDRGHPREDEPGTQRGRTSVIPFQGPAYSLSATTTFCISTTSTDSRPSAYPKAYPSNSSKKHITPNTTSGLNRPVNSSDPHARQGEYTDIELDADSTKPTDRNPLEP